MPSFLQTWIFFFSEGTCWYILTVGPFLSVAKNRSPWKHYASHSLSGNTRDSEPWRICEYVSKCVCVCMFCVQEHACMCVCVCMCAHAGTDCTVCSTKEKTVKNKMA